MTPVISPHLAAVGAVWVDGPEVGNWIAARLGRFGPSVGHAVPLGYAAYAIVPISEEEDAGRVDAPMVTLGALLDLIEPHTARQSVYSAIWEG